DAVHDQREQSDPPREHRAGRIRGRLQRSLRHGPSVNGPAARDKSDTRDGGAYDGGMNRLRVASLQYFIRPVQRFEQFAEQVEALVWTARDYKARLLVFPEYFSCQLLTLNDTREPIHRQIRHLARLEDRIVELMQRLSRESGMYIVGGTLPAVDPPDEETV